MLAAMPVLNQQNNLFSNAMAQGYDDYDYSDSYSHTLLTIKNMNVEQVHMKDFL